MYIYIKIPNNHKILKFLQVCQSFQFNSKYLYGITNTALIAGNKLKVDSHLVQFAEVYVLSNKSLALKASEAYLITSLSLNYFWSASNAIHLAVTVCVCG